MPHHRIVIETRASASGGFSAWVAEGGTGMMPTFSGWGETPKEALADVAEDLRRFYHRDTFDFMHVEA